jgi:hypothetical protein
MKILEQKLAKVTKVTKVTKEGYIGDWFTDHHRLRTASLNGAASADDFSVPALLMLVVSIGLWTIYGVMRAAPSIWLGNGITTVLTASILSVKLRRVPPSSN